MKKIIVLILLTVLIMTSFVYADIRGEGLKVYIEDKEITLDVQPQIVEGRMMVPLRLTLEAIGYDINWNSKERSVEIVKGPRHTKLYIGKNSYYKHRMAPISLSSEPVVINGRTLVPIEFFHEILDLVFEVRDSRIIFNLDEDETLVTHIGYVRKISKTDFGTQYHLAREQGDEVYLIINSGKDTVFQREIFEEDLIYVISLPIMLLSYPGQTGAIVIY